MERVSVLEGRRRRGSVAVAMAAAGRGRMDGEQEKRGQRILAAKAPD